MLHEVRCMLRSLRNAQRMLSVACYNAVRRLGFPLLASDVGTVRTPATPCSCRTIAASTWRKTSLSDEWKPAPRRSGRLRTFAETSGNVRRRPETSGNFGTGRKLRAVPGGMRADRSVDRPRGAKPSPIRVGRKPWLSLVSASAMGRRGETQGSYDPVGRRCACVPRSALRRVPR